MLLCLSLVWAQPRKVKDIPLPKGFASVECAKKSYSAWITDLPLKSAHTVNIFDGRVVPSGRYDVIGVVDMPLLFKQDLEQCADYCFRFWAEYHKDRKILDHLSLFDYNGNKRSFRKSKKSFRGFLKWVMAHANSYSLKKATQDVSPGDIKPGDMIVQNETGGIGHVSVIMNVCESEKGERLYLIGFSFMPAQEFHIERAKSGQGREGWYTLDGYYDFLLEYLDLGTPVLKRFIDG